MDFKGQAIADGCGHELVTGIIHLGNRIHRHDRQCRFDGFGIERGQHFVGIDRIGRHHLRKRNPGHSLSSQRNQACENLAKHSDIPSIEW